MQSAHDRRWSETYFSLINRFVRQQHRNEIMRLLTSSVNTFLILFSGFTPPLLF